jgi:putative phage-type endonuclease
MQSQQHIDILLNRHACDDVVAMVTARSSTRTASARTVAALPPGIQQRTPEWYAARKGMLTASEFKIAGAEKVSQAYVNGKVFPQPFATNDAMTWGCRFEDLACAAYEVEHDTKVREFGLLVHPDAHWIGASPDGITDYGVMIELKCPHSRKRIEIDKRITENRPFPKSDRANLHGRYRPQVQGQLEVCDLEECDFVVAHIDEVDAATFWQLRRVSDTRHRYAVVVDVPKSGCNNGSIAYRTSPLELDDDALSAWLSGVLSVAPDARVWYAHVRELGVERVERDREQWERIRAGLGRTKEAIDSVMAGAAPLVEGAKPIVGNPSLFGPDGGDDGDDTDERNETPSATASTVNSSASAKKRSGPATKTTTDGVTKTVSAPLSMFSMDDD